MRVSIPIVEPEEKKGLGSLFQSHDSKIEAVVAKHLSVLARKRLQLLTKDEYGKYRKRGWQNELSNFLSDVLIPEMPWWHSLKSKKPTERQLTKAAKIVERLVAEECARSQQVWNSNEVPRDGVGYEQYCGRLLADNGWKVTFTKISGDQGVDIIGEHRGNVFVFQCKRVSRALGNKAVQEVVAGRKFYRAHVGVVVSNADYTSAAKSLAAVNGIILLHHSDLPRLDSELKASDRRST
jgi:restriction system protein